MKIWILNIACLFLCLPPMASAQTYRYEPAVVTLQGRLLSAPVITREQAGSPSPQAANTTASTTNGSRRNSTIL